MSNQYKNMDEEKIIKYIGQRYGIFSNEEEEEKLKKLNYNFNLWKYNNPDATKEQKLEKYKAIVEENKLEGNRWIRSTIIWMIWECDNPNASQNDSREKYQDILKENGVYNLY